MLIERNPIHRFEIVFHSPQLCRPDVKLDGKTFERGERQLFGEWQKRFQTLDAILNPLLGIVLISSNLRRSGVEGVRLILGIGAMAIRSGPVRIARRVHALMRGGVMLPIERQACWPMPLGKDQAG